MYIKLSILVLLIQVQTLVLALFSRVHMRDLQTITVRSDQMATSRRTTTIAQLRCIGRYCETEAVRTAQCYNQGTDGQDIQWKCVFQDLNRRYRVSRFEVNCEGYDYPRDPFITVGSCAVAYQLDRSRSDCEHGCNGGLKTDRVDPIVIIVLIAIVAISVFMGYYICQCFIAPPQASPFVLTDWRYY